MRKCKACGEIKHITDFYTRPDSENGYRNTCKQCTNKKLIGRSIDETGNRYGKWIVISKDTVSTVTTTKWLCKCDCGKYKSVLGTSLRNSSSTSCGCVKPRSKDSIYKSFYRSYKNGAESRKLTFDLTLEDFLLIINNKCHYCGQDPLDTKFFYSRNGKDTENFILVNGVDRVDSSLGYDNENIVTCCKVCNSMKSNLTYKVFTEKINMIYNNLKDKND